MIAVDAAAQAARAAVVAIGVVAGRASPVCGSDLVLFARLVAESVRGAGGAALFGARAHSHRPAACHRRQLPGGGLARRLADFSRGRVELLAAPDALAVFLLATGQCAFRPPGQLAGHREPFSRPIPWHAILGIGYKTLPYSDFIGQTIVADNMYLSLLVETGIVGLAAFLLLNFAILRTAWQSRPARRFASLRSSEPGSFVSGSEQLFQMLSGDLFTYWRVLPLYFWVLAMASVMSPVSLLFLDQFNQLGGAQRCLLDLLPAFLDAGYDTHLAVPGDGPLADGARSCGAVVHPHSLRRVHIRAEELDRCRSIRRRSSASGFAHRVSGVEAPDRSDLREWSAIVAGRRHRRAGGRPVVFHAHSIVAQTSRRSISALGPAIDAMPA